MKNEKYPQHWIRSNKLQYKIVLAVDPTIKGIGFCVFRGPHEPLDWGTTDIRFGKNLHSLRKIKRLVRTYDPDIIITEDTDGNGSFRCSRIKKLISKLSSFCNEENIEFATYSPGQIKEVFSNFGVTTKYEIAQKIVSWLPELNSALPEKRKCYLPEPVNYGIFDAVALALTYFYLES